MKKRREIEKWRWELEEPKKEIIVPTLGEQKKKGLSTEEAIRICSKKYENAPCFREYSGHALCKGCPKSKKPKINEEWSKGEWVKESEAFIGVEANKIVSKRR